MSSERGIMCAGRKPIQGVICKPNVVRRVRMDLYAKRPARKDTHVYAASVSGGSDVNRTLSCTVISRTPL